MRREGATHMAEPVGREKFPHQTCAPMEFLASRPERRRAAAELQAAEADLIVLQLGNFEADMLGLSDMALVRVSRRSRHPSSDVDPSPTRPPRHPMARTLVHSLFHAPFIAHAVMFGKSYRANLEACYTSFEAIIDRSTQEYPDARIIVVSPFPSLHAKVQFARRALNTRFSKIAAKYRLDYLDVFRVLSPLIRFDDLVHGHRYFCDAFHLDRQGHARLADALAPMLRRAVDERDLRSGSAND